MMLLLAQAFGDIQRLTAICLNELQPLTLNAFRFITGFLVLGTIYFKRLRGVNKKTLQYSVLVACRLWWCTPARPTA